MDSQEEDRARQRTISIAEPEGSKNNEATEEPRSTEPSNASLAGPSTQEDDRATRRTIRFAEPERSRNNEVTEETRSTEPGSSSLAGPSNRPPPQRSNSHPLYARVEPPPGLTNEVIENALRAGEYSSVGAVINQGTLAPGKTKGKGKEKEEPFDAAKTGKIPKSALHLPPQWQPAVRVTFVNERIGLGLVAARPFSKDEWIFQEAPAMSVQYIPNARHYLTNELKTLQLREYERFVTVIFQTEHGRLFGMELLRVTYPRFAAAMGIATSVWARAEGILNYGLQQKLVQGIQGDSVVDRGEYEEWISKIDFHTRPSENRQKDVCREFFHHYAFLDDAEERNSDNPDAVVGANFYLLGSLINHRCIPIRKTAMDKMHEVVSSTFKAEPKGPNCAFRVGPQGLAQFIQPTHLAVQATRDIAAGEELTISYGKRKSLGFVCRCVDCEGTTKVRLLDKASEGLQKLKDKVKEKLDKK